MADDTLGTAGPECGIIGVQPRTMKPAVNAISGTARTEMVKRLLLVIGGTSFSDAAVKWAVDIAGRNDAEITALPLLDPDSWKESLRAVMGSAEAARLLETRPWEIVSRQRQRLLRQVERACVKSDVRYRFAPPEGDPLDQIASLWRYQDLVVFGLRGLFDQGVVPEPEKTLARLIRTGVRPIFAVSRRFRPIRRTLIAYNGSIESAKTLKQFVQMRLWPEAHVEIACFGCDEARAGALLEDAAAYCRAHGLSPVTVSVDGSAAQRLLPYASEQSVDLIVIGGGYRHLLLRGLLGDTLSLTARHSHVPLFVSH